MTVIQRISPFFLRISLVLMLLILAWSSCKNKEKTPAPFVPECIKGKIKEFEGLSGKYQPAYIKSYTYKGKTVYYVPPRCCDQMSEVLDENCNVLCRPEGGITGKGDGKCPDFPGTATDGKVIWEPR